MEIAEVIKRKHDTENKINAAINELLAELCDSTGIRIHGVDIDMSDVTTHVDEGRMFVVTGVNIDARL